MCNVLGFFGLVEIKFGRGKFCSVVRVILYFMSKINKFHG